MGAEVKEVRALLQYGMQARHVCIRLLCLFAKQYGSGPVLASACVAAGRLIGQVSTQARSRHVGNCVG
jgi:hypothetical protein